MHLILSVPKFTFILPSFEMLLENLSNQTPCGYIEMNKDIKGLENMLLETETTTK